MKFSKFLERFFPKVLIGVWLNKGRYYLHTKHILPSGSSTSESMSFDADVELDKLFDYLGKIQQENIVTYIAILDQSKVQGAIPTAESSRYIDFKEVKEVEDFNDIIFKPQYGKWSIFSLKTEIIHIQNRFQQSGLDFIFSPFLLPIAIRKRFKLPESTSIYIFSEKEFTIFSIFKGDNLLYGVISDNIDHNDKLIEESKEEIENDKLFASGQLDSDIEKSEKYKDQASSIYFDEGEVDVEIDKLDEIDNKRDELDIQDELFDLSILDEDDDNNSDSINKEDERLDVGKFLDKEPVDEDKNEDLIPENEVNHQLIYEIMRVGVSSFYHEKEYPSDFIESCYILTSLKVDNSFMQKIEGEFSFETEKVRVNISELLVDLIGEELDRGKA